MPVADQPGRRHEGGGGAQDVGEIAEQLIGARLQGKSKPADAAKKMQDVIKAWKK